MNGNQNRRYYIAGYDVSKWVTAIDGLTNKETKPDWGEMPDIPRLELTMINDRSNFSTVSDNSMLFGETLQNLELKVTTVQGSTETTEWLGVIETCIEDLETFRTTLTGMSYFSKYLDSPALIELGIDTPANLAKAIFELFNIPIDETSFAAANAIQQNVINVQLDPNLLTSQTTLMDIQKKLATAGVARIYSVNGKMKYESFITSSPTISLDISERRIFDHPKVSRKEQKQQWFTVNYLDGSISSSNMPTGASNTSLDFGSNSDVIITSATGAIFTADGWANAMATRNQSNIEVGIDRRIGDMLTLESFFTLSIKQINWINQPVEVVAIDKTDPRYIIIEALTI